MKRKRGEMKTMTSKVLVAVLITMISGCSVYMAAKQPGAKDLSVLSPGTPRNHVIAALGTPALSETREGVKVDTFAFKQGYSRGAKTARAFVHGVADVFTLGLWEVIGTPIEVVANGTDMRIEVVYDDNDRVRSTATAAPVAPAKAAEPPPTQEPRYR